MVSPYCRSLKRLRWRTFYYISTGIASTNASAYTITLRSKPGVIRIIARTGPGGSLPHGCRPSAMLHHRAHLFEYGPAASIRFAQSLHVARKWASTWRSVSATNRGWRSVPAPRPGALAKDPAYHRGLRTLVRPLSSRSRSSHHARWSVSSAAVAHGGCYGGITCRAPVLVKSLGGHLAGRLTRISRADRRRCAALSVSSSGAAGSSREDWAGAHKVLIALSISPNPRSIRPNLRDSMRTLYYRSCLGSRGWHLCPPFCTLSRLSLTT
jgi:hypothetical protein